MKRLKVLSMFDGLNNLDIHDDGYEQQGLDLPEANPTMMRKTGTIPFNVPQDETSPGNADTDNLDENPNEYGCTLTDQYTVPASAEERLMTIALQNWNPETVDPNMKSQQNLALPSQVNNMLDVPFNPQDESKKPEDQNTVHLDMKVQGAAEEIMAAFGAPPVIPVELKWITRDTRVLILLATGVYVFGGPAKVYVEIDSIKVAGIVNDKDHQQQTVEVNARCSISKNGKVVKSVSHSGTMAECCKYFINLAAKVK